VRFWSHFGTLGGSFGVCWRLLATLGLPRAPLRGPSRKSNENVGSFTALWALLGGPFDDNFRYFACLFVTFSVCFFEACFLRLLESRGTHSNCENDGFVYTKPLFSHFHLELQNHRKLCLMDTFWDAFERFLVVVGHHSGDEEIVLEIGWPKGAQLIPGDPRGSERIGNDPCFPY
jgi:hypothetical protein